MRSHQHKLKKSLTLAAFLLVTLAPNSYAGLSCCRQTHWLITPEEMAADAKAPEPVVKKSLPIAGAPRIQLLAPTVTQPVPTPFPIEIKFQPAPDARVIPDTFKVLWGRLGIDITKRVLEQTKVTESGLQLANAKVPPGSHRLRLLIEDDKQRVGELFLTLEVKE